MKPAIKMVTPVDTPAYRLFHHSYPVMMQNKVIYPPKFCDKMGWLAGTKEQINAFYNDYTAQAKTPVAMILLFDQGIEVSFVNILDLVQVYRDIKAHLEGWANEIKQPFGLRPPPADQLLLMDRYAQEIAYAAEQKILMLNLADPNSNAYNRDDFFASFSSDMMLDGVDGSPIAITPPEQHEIKNYDSPIFDAWDVSPWREI